MFKKNGEAHDLELVGVVRAYQEHEDHLRIEFACTNKEVFLLRFPPAIKRAPLDHVIRVWAKRTTGPQKEQVCLHWEEL